MSYPPDFVLSRITVNRAQDTISIDQPPAMFPVIAYRTQRGVVVNALVNLCVVISYEKTFHKESCNIVLTLTMVSYGRRSTAPFTLEIVLLSRAQNGKHVEVARIPFSLGIECTTQDVRIMKPLEPPFSPDSFFEIDVVRLVPHAQFTEACGHSGSIVFGGDATGDPQTLPGPA